MFKQIIFCFTLSVQVTDITTWRHLLQFFYYSFLVLTRVYIDKILTFFHNEFQHFPTKQQINPQTLTIIKNVNRVPKPIHELKKKNVTPGEWNFDILTRAHRVLLPPQTPFLKFARHYYSSLFWFFFIYLDVSLQ
jgi:hypothetical protein